jgi:SAM-dependent methyltransferase
VGRYALPQEGAEAPERERLALLAELWDPLTEHQLEDIGVGEGWRCLDAGAGSGAVTRLLAERVGSSGSVLAIDLDTRLLDEVAGGIVEVRRHDLLADPLPEAAFDLVHARNLLMHLPSRQRALRRLAAAVRPGGWIAVGDVDFTTMEPARPNPAWHRVWSAFCDATIATGWDVRYGARLQGDLEALELTDLRVESYGRRLPSGSRWAQLFAATLERLREQLRAVGADDDDLREALRLLRAEGDYVRNVTSWLGHGRRPAP